VIFSAPPGRQREARYHHAGPGTGALAALGLPEIRAVQERRKLVQLLEQGGIASDVGSWLKEVEESTVQALAARGEATAAELSEDEPRLLEQLLLKGWARGSGRSGSRHASAPPWSAS